MCYILVNILIYNINLLCIIYSVYYNLLYIYNITDFWICGFWWYNADFLSFICLGSVTLKVLVLREEGYYMIVSGWNNLKISKSFSYMTIWVILRTSLVSRCSFSFLYYTHKCKVWALKLERPQSKSTFPKL